MKYVNIVYMSPYCLFCGMLSLCRPIQLVKSVHLIREQVNYGHAGLVYGHAARPSVRPSSRPPVHPPVRPPVGPIGLIGPIWAHWGPLGLFEPIEPIWAHLVRVYYPIHYIRLFMYYPSHEHINISVDMSTYLLTC